MSHLLFIGLLWITFSNIKTAPSIFDVNIVGPIEAERQPLPKIMQPKVTAPKPLIQKQHQQPPDKKLLPETLFGEGRWVQPSPDTRKAPEEVTGKQEGFSDEKGDLPLDKDQPVLVPPSALFDRKTIEKFGKKETPADKGLTFEIPGFKNRGYMRMLKEKIESIWRYPKEAARLGISGDLYLKFSIKKDGKLGEVELLRTSGYKDLDEAAMKALKDAEPFWPLPSDWEEEDLEIKGHFIYIYGNAIVM